MSKTIENFVTSFIDVPLSECIKKIFDLLNNRSIDAPIASVQNCARMSVERVSVDVTCGQFHHHAHLQLLSNALVFKNTNKTLPNFTSSLKAKMFIANILAQKLPLEH
jgi:hypothetical protein